MKSRISTLPGVPSVRANCSSRMEFFAARSLTRISFALRVGFRRSLRAASASRREGVGASFFADLAWSAVSAGFGSGLAFSDRS